MKRFLPVMLATFVVASCGQSDETAPAAESMAPETVAAEPVAAEPVAESAAPAEPEASRPEAAAAEDSAADAAASTQSIQVAQADLSAVEAAGFVEGRNYRRISPTQPTSSSADSVEVAEFFMYSCIHCYNLEPYIQSWLETKPAHIEFVRVPTTWDAYRRLHAQAYYAAKSLGIDEEITLPFFQEIHVNGNYLDTEDKLAALFGRFGVSNDDFESVFNSFAVATQTNRADELGRRYRVDSTPTIVINGKYRTGVDMAGGTPEKLFELIEALAAAELGR